LFDGPDGGGIIERRNQSIVAPQALYLMNDPVVDRLARSLAHRIDREVPGGMAEQRVTRLYELALGRPPSVAELETGIELLTDATLTEGWSRLCLVVLSLNEFVYVD